MTKDTKTPSSSTTPKSPSSGASSPAAPRKKLTLNTTAFQKKLSSISVNNILEEVEYMCRGFGRTFSLQVTGTF